MMIRYYVEKEKAQKLMCGGNLSEICVDGFEEIEINIDCNTRKVTIYGMGNDSDSLLDDNAYAYVPAIEEVAEARENGDYYVTNVEIARYLEFFDIPFAWALDAVDEWRSPESEEELLTENKFWCAVDGIKTAWEISRKES